MVVLVVSFWLLGIDVAWFLHPSFSSFLHYAASVGVQTATEGPSMQKYLCGLTYYTS